MDFNPKFLNELVEDLHLNKSKPIKEIITEQILKSDLDKGKFWEQVLAKHMPHTNLLKNGWYMDFDDGTDAKFATLSNIGSKKNGLSTFQATIHIRNKTGPLRVCMCATTPGSNNPKVYFMYIPFEGYKSFLDRTNEFGIPHPIKITFSNFSPYGELWNKYQTNFKGVTRQAKNFDNYTNIVYTDLDLYIRDNV